MVVLILVSTYVRSASSVFLSGASRILSCCTKPLEFGCRKRHLIPSHVCVVALNAHIVSYLNSITHFRSGATQMRLTRGLCAGAQRSVVKMPTRSKGTPSPPFAPPLPRGDSPLTPLAPLSHKGRGGILPSPLGGVGQGGGGDTRGPGVGGIPPPPWWGRGRGWGACRAGDG